jgi:hypothetical protein
MLISRKRLLILLIGLAAVSCSSPKTISREELNSDLLAAISLSSETELFISQLQKSRVTTQFAEVHLEYLTKEVARSAHELSEGTPNDGLAGAAENCHAQLKSLANILTGLKGKTGDMDRLSADKQQVERIQNVLEHSKVGL